MTTETHRPNRPVLIAGGLISGAGIAAWVALWWFTDAWQKAAPKTPAGDAVYAHANHGITYFTATQATAANLEWPRG